MRGRSVPCSGRLLVNVYMHDTVSTWYDTTRCLTKVRKLYHCNINSSSCVCVRSTFDIHLSSLPNVGGIHKPEILLGKNAERKVLIKTLIQMMAHSGSHCIKRVTKLYSVCTAVLHWPAAAKERSSAAFLAHQNWSITLQWLMETSQKRVTGVLRILGIPRRWKLSAIMVLEAIVTGSLDRPVTRSVPR